MQHKILLGGLALLAAGAAVSGWGYGHSSSDAGQAQRPFKLIDRPVIVLAGDTFEMRLKFDRALPTRTDGTVRAYIDVPPAGTDSPPTVMRKSRGHCYRQTATNDARDPGLAAAHDGSKVTMTIVIVDGRVKHRLSHRVAVTTNPDATPHGCVVHPGP